MQLKSRWVQEKARLTALMFLATSLFPLTVVHGGVMLGMDGEPPPVPKLHIIAIGINTYRSPLKYARADAVAVAEALKKSFNGPVQSQVLVDEHATREAIEAAMNAAVADAKPLDVFVFYYGGYSHAVGDQEFYLLPANVDVKVNLGVKQLPFVDLPSQAISASKLKAWMSRLPANNQLVILDSSAGEHLVATMVSRLEGGDARGSKLSDRRFMILGTEGMGHELDELKHGIFTFDLLQGLSGEADRLPKDGIITAGELDMYVRGQALQRSESAGVDQKIVSATIGGNFSVAGVGFRGVGVEEAPTLNKNASQTDMSRGRDYALLIATDDYDAWTRLSNPIHDARAIATDLQEIYGFETELLENPTRGQVHDVLGKYRNKNYSPTDQLVIFIAGHGMYLDETREGFLITKESRLPKEDKWGDSFFPHTRLRDLVDLIPAQHIFLILDACFGGTFDQRIADSGHRGEDEYREVSAGEIKNRKIKYKSRRYLTSGGKEYVPDGRPGNHSPFARKLLEAFRSYGGQDGYLTIGKIKQHVEKVTPEPREGEFGSHAPGGDLVLLPQGKTRK